MTQGSTQRAISSTSGCDAITSPTPPIDIASVLEQARELYGVGRLEEAESVLVNAISLRAGCSPNGASLVSSNAPPLQTDPATATSTAQLLKLLGDVRVDAYRYGDAIESYTQAIELGGASVSRGAYFGRANAFEGEALKALKANNEDNETSDALYLLAVQDYSKCLEGNYGDNNVSSKGSLIGVQASLDRALITFERAQAWRALRNWKEARLDYTSAAALFLAGKDKKRSDIATAQSAFCAFEAGDLQGSLKTLETLSRRLYSSDVRASLVATYYRVGDFSKAENLWLELCELDDAKCGKYTDRAWLLEYRRWTPGVIQAMQDFLGMR